MRPGGGGQGRAEPALPLPQEHPGGDAPLARHQR